MKRMIMLGIVLSMLSSTPVYAFNKDYSEETKMLMREAGLQTERLEWI